jgi:hypothetical protein
VHSKLDFQAGAVAEVVEHLGCQWLMPVILAIQEAEIRRIIVRSQPGQIVCETLSQKKKKNVDGVAQGIGPEFKPQYCKN